MNAGDRAEVRELLTDILAGPLEKIDGQLRLLVQQNSSIETQVLKTNGRVTDLEDQMVDVEIVLAKDLPHTTASCPHTAIISEIYTDVSNIKTGFGIERKFNAGLRSNISLILVVAGLIVTIIIGSLNLRKNDKTLTGQETIKKEADKNMQTQIDKVDSLFKKY